MERPVHYDLLGLLMVMIGLVGVFSPRHIWRSHHWKSFGEPVRATRIGGIALVITGAVVFAFAMRG